jgi:CoA:oxalate CoA-transferase
VTEHRRPPLDGIVVVDLTQIYNGPYATCLLAQAGARVVKVEPPGGEPLRRRGVVGGAALPFAMLNANKDDLCVDLKTEGGRALLREMVAKADVLVENFAPGTMDRLGLGWDTLRVINPRLVYACSSGFGLSGPYRDYPAMDLTVQAMAGVMSITGFPDREPVKAGAALCDFFAGVHLYGGVVTALFERERTGEGRLVEVSMQEAVYASLSSSLGLMFGNDWQAPPRTGNRHAGMAESPYNVYPTRDGHLAIICVGDRHWQVLCDAMGRPELAFAPGFDTLQGRVERMDEIDAIVGAYTARHDKQALFETLSPLGVPCAPVRTLDEVVNDVHLHERGALRWVEHPELGRIVVQASPMRYHGTPLAEHRPSGALGADAARVLGEWLGHTPAQIDTMKETGVIR